MIIGGVEVNPGPSSSLNLNFGILNTMSVVNKAPLLHCLITDNDLSFLALTETWVKIDVKWMSYLVSTTSLIHPSNSNRLTLASSLETLCWLTYTVVPPQAIFLEEFGSLLATLGTDAANRLMISGDFNLPGTSSNEIDDDLADLLNSTGFTQHISSPTRHDSNQTKSSLLDLIITPSTSTFISTTSVVSSHEISDHDQQNATNLPREHINIKT